MPKRMQRKDFSRCEESKRRKAIVEEQIDINLPTSSVEEDLVSGVIDKDTVSLYYLQLKISQHSIIVLDKAATNFFLQDFNLKSNKLWDKHYVSLTRKSCLFEEVPEWIYSCQCDKAKSDLFQATGQSIHMTYEEWTQLNSFCLHIKVLNIAMRKFDAMFSLSPAVDQGTEDEGNIETPDDSPFVHIQKTLISVKPPAHPWGILTVGAQGMKCLSCTFSNCAHVMFVLDSLEKECCPDFVTEFHAACTIELSNTLQSTQESIKSTCLSYKQIPFEDIGTVKVLLDFNGNVLSAVDEGGICHVCGAGPLEIQSPPKELTLFTQYRRRSVLIHNAFSQCQHVIPFDGSQYGILNMGNFLIGHDVLRDYLNNFLRGRMPLYTFYVCWKQRQLDADNAEAGMLSYSKFRLAWYSFLSLMSWDLRPDFSYPICQDSPNVVIFDATGLAFRRSYVPKTALDASPVQEQGTSGSRFKDRVFINHRQTRDLIQRYCNPQRPLENLNTLFPLLDKHCPSIKAVVNWCLDGETTQSKLPPKEVRPLLMSLAKPSPVCALVPPTDEMRLLLDEMKSSDIKRNPVMLQSLQKMCPILFHLVKDLKWREGSLPESFYALLTTLWSKSIAPFANGLSSTGSISNSDNNASYSAFNSAGSATNSAINASNSAGSPTNSAGSATNSAGSVSNSADSATNSAGSATNSAGSTSNSAGSATNSAGSATNSAGSASHSARSVTNSAGSETYSAGSTSNSAGSASHSASSAPHSASSVTNSAGRGSNSAGIATNSTGSTSNSAASTTDSAGSVTNSAGSATNSSGSASHSAGNGELNDFLESLSFWPNLPTVRDRGRYSHDNKSHKQACRKLGRLHKSLLPGTVTMHCEHDICYGFEVMLQMNDLQSITRIHLNPLPRDQLARGRQEFHCSFFELRSACESAAQVVHTMCYMKKRILLGEHHQLKLRGVGPPAWGDYEVYLIQ